MMLEWSFGLGEFPWKALLFWYFCLLLFDWGWKEAGSFFSETQNLSPSPPLGAPLFGPIFLHTFSHDTSKTLLCFLGGLGVICWWYFCLYILLSVVWPVLGRKGWHLDLNWLIWIKLGLWSCQLWYQCPSWVLTLLTKWDSGFIALTSFIPKFVSSYLSPPAVVTHFLLSPFLPSSTPASFFINRGNPLSITPLISPDLLSSLKFPLLSSPPNGAPDLGVSLLD